ncbi:hypothetical protein E2C01_011146 [Portunus trituberculatus]|uniref:Uncharacterized protein n=1 Tax=Portunus trituberculatus TaxID=210409 RepID=A0A5B7DA97_PORTR|nr:hypothetical protein [Portunus trituberculatus]
MHEVIYGTWGEGGRGVRPVGHLLPRATLPPRPIPVHGTPLHPRLHYHHFFAPPAQRQYQSERY